MYPEENIRNRKEETPLSKAVRLAEDKAAYDAACKRILAQKRILAVSYTHLYRPSSMKRARVSCSVLEQVWV